MPTRSSRRWTRSSSPSARSSPARADDVGRTPSRAWSWASILVVGRVDVAAHPAGHRPAVDGACRSRECGVRPCAYPGMVLLSRGHGRYGRGVRHGRGVGGRVRRPARRPIAQTGLILAAFAIGSGLAGLVVRHCASGGRRCPLRFLIQLGRVLDDPAAGDAAGHQRGPGRRCSSAVVGLGIAPSLICGFGLVDKLVPRPGAHRGPELGRYRSERRLRDAGRGGGRGGRGPPRRAHRVPDPARWPVRYWSRWPRSRYGTGSVIERRSAPAVRALEPGSRLRDSSRF